jgi:hypothetical protein
MHASIKLRTPAANRNRLLIGPACSLDPMDVAHAHEHAATVPDLERRIATTMAA